MRWLILLVVACGCNTYNPYEIDSYSNVTHYSINYTAHTDKGIGLDGALDAADIDRRTDEVEACLLNLYPDGKLATDTLLAGSCIVQQFDPHIQRQYIGVKVAPDWFRACYDEHWQYVGVWKGEQVFPGDTDPKLCEAKGFVVTPECPCAYRAIIQDDATIITAPNLHLYKSELIRLVTGCNNIWTTNLAQCYSPD
jgi:hypothetical protein